MKLNIDELIVASLNRLRNFDGEPELFWGKFINASSRLLQADNAYLMLVSESDCELMVTSAAVSHCGEDLLAELKASAQQTLESSQGSCLSVRPDGGLLFSGRLDLELEQGRGYLIASYLISAEQPLSDRVLRSYFGLAADIPVSYSVARKLKDLPSAYSGSSNILQVLASLQGIDDYRQAVVNLCNEVADVFGYQSVSFGWQEKGYIRLQMMSHSDKFDRKMLYCRTLEDAMEEAYEQEREIIVPGDDGHLLCDNHHQIIRQSGASAMASLPILYRDQVVAVISLSRNEGAITEEDLRYIKILLDQLIGQIYSLKIGSKNILHRAGIWLADKANGLLSVEQALPKMSAGLLLIALLALWLVKINYRVEATFVLKSENVHHLVSPFDGYIDDVYAEVGDSVTQGQTLLKLNTDDLLLQQASLIADINRYQREIDKYRAVAELADMKISQARYNQSVIQLKNTRNYIQRSLVSATQTGVVIDGDLSRNIGAPLKKGELLYKISPLDKLYVEIDLEETYIHEVKVGQPGEVIFQSNPSVDIPITLSMVSPAASVKQAKNIFSLKANIDQSRQEWWHPGMSGIAKIEVGQRSVLWILTHKTSNYLTKVFWI